MSGETSARIRIQLGFDRDLVGRIWGEDASGVIFGPRPIAGRAADSIAADHANPTRSCFLPFGDPPTGRYEVSSIEPTGAGSSLRGDLYGDVGALVLVPIGGDAALADATGRFRILIHGGCTSGALRVTSGNFRMFDDDLVALMRLWESLDRPVVLDCEEVGSDRSDGDRLEMGAGGDADEEAFAEIAARTVTHSSGWQNLVAFGEYIPGGKPINDDQSTKVHNNAEDVAKDYATRGVGYQKGGDASGGGNTSDCSHFVHDALQRAGVDVPYTTTRDIGSSPHFEKVPAGQERAGDVIVQGEHMGVYTGEKDAGGHPIGTQMGDHGAKDAPWGPGGWFGSPDSTKYYRPKQ